jgi:hypothetical protein
VVATRNGSPELFRKGDLMASSSSLRRKTSGKSPGMTPQRIIGICMLLVGVSLFVVGLAVPHTADPLATTTPGSFSRVSTWYALGGIAIALLGFILAVFGMQTRSARR